MKEKITFTDLIDKIASETGATKTLIHDLLSETVALNRESLEKDGHQNISGFGRFSLKWHKARTGRHPQTGEIITIEAHNTLNFNPQTSLKDYINRKYAHLEAELVETKKPIIEKEASKTPIPGLTKEPFVEQVKAPPIVEEVKAPIVEEIKEPIVEEVKTPIVEEVKEPIVEEVKTPIVEEVKTPIVVEKETPFKSIEDEKPVAASTQEPILEKEVIKSQKRIISEEKRSPFFSRETKKSNNQYFWLFIPLLLIILFFLFWLSLDDSQRIDYHNTKVKDNNTTTEKTIIPVTENKDQTINQNKPTEEAKIVKSESTAPEIINTSGFPELRYTVQPNDYLYNIARKHYKKESLWPLIYSANRNLMQNPDLLAPPGKTLILPGLQGTPENLSMQDKKDLAKAYMEVYFFYKDSDSEKAVYHLWVAKKLDTSIMEGYSNSIYFKDIEAVNRFNGKLVF